MVERVGYREIFVPLNAGNGSNTGVAIEIARLRGESARESEFSSLMRLGRKAQMFFAERDAARDHVVDKFVEQGVVVHRVHLFR